MADVLSAAIDAFLNDMKKQMRKDFNKTLERVSDRMVLEAQLMYDTFIDQFYAYSTSVYTRHGEGVGTQTGHNLYRGQQIEKIYKGDMPGVKIEFSAKKMDGGYHHGYKRFPQDSAEDVLNMVLLGWRFPYPDSRHFGDGLSWSGSYRGSFFNFDGTPFDAFQKFEKDFDKNSEKLFMEIWDKLDW